MKAKRGNSIQTSNKPLRKGEKPITVDELIRKYAAEAKERKPLPVNNHDELVVKAINLPYSETMSKVDVHFNLNDSQKISLEARQERKAKSLFDEIKTSKDDSSIQYSNANQSIFSKFLTATKLMKKYPRFCSNINFTSEDLLYLKPRSEPWIIKFMELCYDDAILCLNTPPSSGHESYCNGLNVGTLDAFPLVVQRFISRKYSVMEIKKTISLEVLCTIELLMNRADTLRFKQNEQFHKKQTKNNVSIIFDCGRANLFTKFLSEEYDIDALAQFLRNRDLIQTELKRKLKDLTTNKIWVSQEMEDLDPTQTNECFRSPLKGSKMISNSTSISVSSSLTTLSPLKAVRHPSTSSYHTTESLDLSSQTLQPLRTSNNSPQKALRLLKKSIQMNSRYPNEDLEIKEKVVPITLPNHWNFIEDIATEEAPSIGFHPSILSYLCQLIVPCEDIDEKRYLQDRIWEVALIDCTLKDCSQEEKKSRIEYIPLYSFLRAISLEWKKISKEEKDEINNVKILQESLKSLHDIYKDNCKMLTECEERVFHAENELTLIVAKLTKLKKDLRRLEKKWDLKINTEEDSNTIAFLKEEITRTTTDQISWEQKLIDSKKEKEELKHNVEKLWKSAMMKPGEQSKSALKSHQPTKLKVLGPAKPLPEWVRFINMLIPKTIHNNMLKFHAFLDAKEEANKAWGQTQTIKTSRPATSLSTSSSVVSSSKSSRQSRRPSVMMPTLAKLPINSILVETLARIVTRSVIDDAKRKVLLRHHIKTKEHQLLMQLSSSYAYQQRQLKLQQEKEKKLQEKRISFIKLVTQSYVPSFIDTAKSKAAKRLYNPWYHLDLSIDELYQDNPSRLIQIQQYLKHCEKLRKYHNLCKIFYALTYDLRNKRKYQMIQRKKLLYCLMHWSRLKQKQVSKSIIYKSWRSYLYRFWISKQLLQQNHLIHQAEVFHDQYLNHTIESKSLSSYLRLWYLNTVHDKAMFMKCRHNQQERRFLKCFYTWRHLYFQKKHQRYVSIEKLTKAMIILQSHVRKYIILRKKRRAKALKTLQFSFFHYVYLRNKRMQRLQHDRQIHELSSYTYVTIYQHKQLSLYHFKLWKQLFKMKIVVQKSLFFKVYSHLLQNHFQRWYKKAHKMTIYLAVRCIKIQSIMRMHLAKKHYLHYYRWKKQFRRLQARIRGYLAVRKFQWEIYYYRHARRVQCFIRCYFARKRITFLRIEDIHYSAKYNQYVKLKYYIDHFPKLLSRLDHLGNTVLHNAASTASKRALKLILRHKFVEDNNAFNNAGLTPLHVILMSDVPNSEECFIYMIEHGFDEDIPTYYEGKSCLLLAIEFKRHEVMNRLLNDGFDTDTPDFQGQTCIQCACIQGDYVAAKALADNDCDLDKLGANGTYVIHDAVTGGNLDILYLLITHHVDLNLREINHQQTALMWACQAGLTDFVRVLIEYAADISALDDTQQHCSHFAAMSNNVQIFHLLREANVDYSHIDNQGNTPLHVATYYNSKEFAIDILHLGIYPSCQNVDGDTPAHIACRYNHLDILIVLSEYDEHIGCLNYNHQTPLGVAKLHESVDCINFLQKHYTTVRSIDNRNELGEIWWDKSIDSVMKNYEMTYQPNGERLYYNKLTGEYSTVPPSIASHEVKKLASTAELPFKKKVMLVKDLEAGETAKEILEKEKTEIKVFSTMPVMDDKILTKHQYYIDYREQQKDIKFLNIDYRAATVINKFARRKIAYLFLARMKHKRKLNTIFTRFFKRYSPAILLYIKHKKYLAAVQIQRIARGYILRKRFYDPIIGRYYTLKNNYAKRVLRYKLWAMYLNYKKRLRWKHMLAIRDAPITAADWEVVLGEAKNPIQRIGLFEVYVYPYNPYLTFTRHLVTNKCTFETPKEVSKYLLEQDLLKDQIKKYGCTIQQLNLIIKIQALYRGYKIRSYYKVLEKALKITLHSKENYMKAPNIDANLYNYTIYVFTIDQDIPRARTMFIECLRRMQYYGPDIAFVLYSYSIFAFITRDENFEEIIALRERGRRAERERYKRLRLKIDGVHTNHHQIVLKENQENATDDPSNIHNIDITYGKVYEMATAGFYRYAATTINNCFAWHCFAACRFLVYDDFPGAFDAFLSAFHTEPENAELKKNFDTMMIYFHGKKKDVRDEIVKRRMQLHAERDADVEENRRIYRDRAKLRLISAKRIQRWYRDRKSLRGFNRFIDAVRENIKRRKKETDRNARRKNLMG